jgi:hypothetical protein
MVPPFRYLAPQREFKPKRAQFFQVMVPPFPGAWLRSAGWVEPRSHALSTWWSPYLRAHLLRAPSLLTTASAVVEPPTDLLHRWNGTENTILIR